MIGFRNRIVHEYFRLDMDMVWNIIQKYVSELIEQIQPLIPPDMNSI
ncbi:MAG: DUF86 domain-containing protein [Phycisphaerae bacterium]|nr:DUF86 domain-containing protein [Phycisphaerae bacterium]